MPTAQHDPAAFETYMVAPRSLDTAGIEALRRVAERVQAIPGGRADQPRPVPGLTGAPRLLISLPRGAVAALQSEFGGALIFDVDAELHY